MPGSFSGCNIGRCLSDVLCAVVGHKKQAGTLAVSTAATLQKYGISYFMLFIAFSGCLFCKNYGRHPWLDKSLFIKSNRLAV